MRDRVLSTLHASLLGIWLGAALLTAFSVAPAAFAALPTRSEAGTFVGGILRVVYLAGFAAGAVAVVITTARGGARRNLRIGLASTVALASVSSIGIAIEIGEMRDRLGPMDALPPDDPQRKTFGMLHGISVLVLFVGMLAALAAIALEGVTHSDSAPSAPRSA